MFRIGFVVCVCACVGACEFSSKPIVEVLNRVVLESGEVAVVVMVLLISRMNIGEGRIGQEVRRDSVVPCGVDHAHSGKQSCMILHTHWCRYTSTRQKIYGR